MWETSGEFGSDGREISSFFRTKFTLFRAEGGEQISGQATYTKTHISCNLNDEIKKNFYRWRDACIGFIHFLLIFVTLYKYFKAFSASERALLHKLCMNISIASILLPLKIFQNFSYTYQYYAKLQNWDFGIICLAGNQFSPYISKSKHFKT